MYDNEQNASQQMNSINDYDSNNNNNNNEIDVAM
jgi:hypothetical protein